MKNKSKILLEQSVEAAKIEEGLVNDFFSGCLKQLGNIKYAELAICIAALRATTLIHQTNHWQTSGKVFYGDHLLFERLYNQSQDGIDGLAEKALGLSVNKLVNPLIQLKQQFDFIKLTNKHSSGDFVLKSFAAETLLLMTINLTLEILEQNQILTPGLENMLQGIYDAHEGHLYLLKHRIS